MRNSTRKETIMRKSEMTNAQLLNSFENACFQVANYPNKKSALDNLSKLETEMAKRLQISNEELDKIRNASL